MPQPPVSVTPNSLPAANSPLAPPYSAGWFRRLNDPGADFKNLHDLCKPIMHMLLLIRKNSKFYNTPARLVVVMRELVRILHTRTALSFSRTHMFPAPHATIFGLTTRVNVLDLDLIHSHSLLRSPPSLYLPPPFSRTGSPSSLARLALPASLAVQRLDQPGVQLY